MNEIEELPCPVEGCEFAVGIDEATAREEMEQHVRWLHLREHEFGENPMPALTMMLMNGLLRPQEFAEEVRRVTEDAFKETSPAAAPPSGKRVAAAACGATAGALVLLWGYNDLLMRSMVTVVLVMFCAAVIVFASLVRSRF